MTADLVEIAKHATGMAATIMRKRRPGTITSKGDRDMATEVDFAVEESLRSFLREETPEIQFFGEESGSGRPDLQEAVWVLDPVDGTANYARGIPLSGVSLCLIEKGRAQVGVIELPFMHERYWAELGRGAEMDGVRLKVSPTRSIGDALVSIGDYAVGRGAAVKNQLRFAVTELLASRVQRVRMFGSAATDLAWVATGRLDASIILSNKTWDTAAGVLIAREAGAQVIDRAGREHTLESDSAIAVTPQLSMEFVKLLIEARFNHSQESNLRKSF